MCNHLVKEASRLCQHLRVGWHSRDTLPEDFPGLVGVLIPLVRVPGSFRQGLRPVVCIRMACFFTGQDSPLVKLCGVLNVLSAHSPSRISQDNHGTTSKQRCGIVAQKGSATRSLCPRGLRTRNPHFSPSDNCHFTLGKNWVFPGKSSLCPPLSERGLSLWEPTCRIRGSVHSSIALGCGKGPDAAPFCAIP